MTYIRRKTRQISIGNTSIGGSAPIRIQTMANTDTNDIDASVAQAIRCIDAGAELLRFTTQGSREAENLGTIHRILNDKGIHTPLVADIHFNPHVAEVAAQYVEKIRINPGNFVNGHTGEYTDEEWEEELEKIRFKLRPLLEKCQQKGTAIRIGVNHGSLSPRIMSRYGNTAEGLAVSCMEFIALCHQEDFDNIILSVKASNTVVMIHAVRLLAEKMQKANLNYPLHLGVTEAGSDSEGRIKSAVGIGTLLHSGIGDTIRVSLSEAPEAEIPVAQRLVKYITEEYLTTDNDTSSPLSTTFSRRLSTAIGIFGGDNTVRVVGNSIYHGNSSLKPDCLMNQIPDGVLVIKASQSPKMLNIRRQMVKAGNSPVVASITYPDIELDELRLRAAADFGPLLIDGLIDGININTTNKGITEGQLTETAYAILQAARARISQTEYISCPSCGRTKFDLPQVVRQVKAATSGYAGLKIAVMGCIVNGPGEMADADYGYIGAGMGKVSLFYKSQCVEKNIPEDEALDHLIDLIESTQVNNNNNKIK